MKYEEPKMEIIIWEDTAVYTVVDSSGNEPILDPNLLG